jgi:Na+-translocating ferredoxin:NAD+ oxidoreductase RnfC subunit
MMPATKQQIVSRVRNAGVIGAGGGGFPTYVKFKAKVSTVIANGSECEPLLTSDRTMMVRHAKLLVDGLETAMQAVEAKEGVIALKAHYEDAVHAIKKVLSGNPKIRLHLLDNYYPAGDEFLLVYEVTKKVIPEGGLPLDVDVVVNNVITLMQVAESMQGKPVVERAVTLAGEFRDPKVVTVPIGITYNELVKIAGGFTRDDVVLIDGGPMMGKIVDDWQNGISKTTSGVLALPKEHFIVTMAEKSLSQMMKLSKAACCQCFRCSDLCPRNLIGHELYPHMTMRTIDYNQAEPAKHITSAFLCSQCGMCELIACDFMMLSPRKIYAAYRKELVSRGVTSPHKRTNLAVRPSFENCKISIPTLMKKLGLTPYDIKIPFAGNVETRLVRIPLNKHIGVPAKPTVKVGSKVRRCDVIAVSPEDKLGSVYHASISGKVTDANEKFIEIES